MHKYGIAFDVGGSFIKSVLLDGNGQICKETYGVYPSRAKAKREEIIDNLVCIIKQQANRILDKSWQLYGIGLAFPGPFDYSNGISYIHGIDKFEAIYSVNLRTELLRRIEEDAFFAQRKCEDFIILFENDVNSFALGQLISGYARYHDRSICITIGTGAGSAFLDGGRLITDRTDVPFNGWIYNERFKESIVDDYISQRGILRVAKMSGLNTQNIGVKDLAESAYNGNLAALQVFEAFGRDVGLMLNQFVDKFHPDAVIIGGQIVKSKELFLKHTYEILNNRKLVIETIDDSSHSTFTGVAHLLLASQQKLA